MRKEAKKRRRRGSRTHRRGKDRSSCSMICHERGEESDDKQEVVKNRKGLHIYNILCVYAEKLLGHCHKQMHINIRHSTWDIISVQYVQYVFRQNLGTYTSLCVKHQGPVEL